MAIAQTIVTTQERAIAKIRRDCGEVLLQTLFDKNTVEVMLNADGKLWVEQLGKGMREIGRIEPARARAILESVAGYHGREIHATSPILECEFPLDGSRFAGQIAPVVPAPTFAIRRKAISVFTLDDYVAKGILEPRLKALICDGVASHKNILVIGGTGSGKTTLVNAVIREIVDVDPDQRVVIIEDTGEIQCTAENAVQYHTSPDVGMTALLRTTLRMRPDRILVGEVRGPEALDLLMAWNTGHPGGAATLHANNARAALSRLAMLISMHTDAPHPVEPLIAEAVDLIVHIERLDGSRRVAEVLAVEGYQDGRYITKTL